MNVVSKLFVAVTSAPLTVRPNAPASPPGVSVVSPTLNTAAETLVCAFSTSKLTVVSAVVSSPSHRELSHLTTVPLPIVQSG